MAKSIVVLAYARPVGHASHGQIRSVHPLARTPSFVRQETGAAAGKTERIHGAGREGRAHRYNRGYCESGSIPALSIDGDIATSTDVPRH